MINGEILLNSILASCHAEEVHQALCQESQNFRSPIFTTGTNKLRHTIEVSCYSVFHCNNCSQFISNVSTGFSL